MEWYFQADDFGENSLGFFNDDNIEEARERASDALENLNGMNSKSAATVLEESQPLAGKQDDISGKPIEIDIADHLGMPVPDDDFGDFPADNMLDGKVYELSIVHGNKGFINCTNLNHQINISPLFLFRWKGSGWGYGRLLLTVLSLH